MSAVEVREAVVTMNGVAGGGHHDTAPHRTTTTTATTDQSVRQHHRAKMNGDTSHPPREKKPKVCRETEGWRESHPTKFSVMYSVVTR